MVCNNRWGLWPLSKTTSSSASCRNSWMLHPLQTRSGLNLKCEELLLEQPDLDQQNIDLRNNFATSICIDVADGPQHIWSPRSHWCGSSHLVPYENVLHNPPPYRSANLLIVSDYTKASRLLPYNNSYLESILHTYTHSRSLACTHSRTLGMEGKTHQWYHWLESVSMII